jgi:aldehyde:ferredoxin oxidoreductase
MIFMERLGPINMDPYSPKAKPAMTIFQQNLFEAVSSSGNCLFTTYAVVAKQAFKIKPFSRTAKIITKVLGLSGPLLDQTGKLLPWGMPIQLPTVIPHSLVVSRLTGMKMTLGKFLQAGERGFNIERLFNLREGVGAETDVLPDRLQKECQYPDRPETRVPLEKMLPHYYKVRGWDKNGVPRGKKLKKLGIGVAAV